MKKLIMLMVMVLVLGSLGFSVNETKVTGKIVTARETLISEGNAILNTVTIEEMIANSFKGGFTLGAGDENAPAFGVVYGWDFSTGAVVSGDELTIAIDTVTTPDEYAKAVVGLTVGKKYKSVLDVKSSSVTTNINFKLGNIAGGSSYVSQAGLTVNVYTDTFTPTGSVVYITLENKSAVTGNVVINSLSIKEVGEVVLNDVATSSVTVSTGNINIPIIVKGTTYYIKANTAQ